MLRLRVVREVASDLVFPVHEDDFCRQVAAGASVLKDEAVNADEECDRLEVKRRVLLEPSGEVGPQRILSSERAGISAGQCGKQAARLSRRHRCSGRESP